MKKPQSWQRSGITKRYRFRTQNANTILACGWVLPVHELGFIVQTLSILPEQFYALSAFSNARGNQYGKIILH